MKQTVTAQQAHERGSLKFELERVFKSDAADILAAREKARILHHGRDIRTAGDEVEMAVRKVLGRKLPSSFYIGHGHIVDEHLRQSSQLDVVIANKDGVPVLFQAENESEYFPYEGVYAIGEVKSSYDSSKQYIHAFADTLKTIRSQLQRKQFKAATPFRLSPLPYGNPLFSFIFFVDQGDFQVEQIRDLYRERPAEELPNIVCILNRGVIVNAVSHMWKEKWIPTEQGKPHSISLIPERNSDYRFQPIEFHWVLTEHGEDETQLSANLANFYYLLMQHLQQCQLTLPDFTQYVNHIFDKTMTTVIY